MISILVACLLVSHAGSYENLRLLETQHDPTIQNLYRQQARKTMIPTKATTNQETCLTGRRQTGSRGEDGGLTVAVQRRRNATAHQSLMRRLTANHEGNNATADFGGPGDSAWDSSGEAEGRATRRETAAEERRNRSATRRGTAAEGWSGLLSAGLQLPGVAEQLAGMAVEEPKSNPLPGPWLGCCQFGYPSSCLFGGQT